MSDHAIESMLSVRAAAAGLSLSSELAAQLAAYYRVLAHWNRTINLTALSNPDEAVDRLLLEPVAAAAHIPAGLDLMDLGSGGGSPAVPLALALGSPRLVMVESRERKAAFLREVLRELQLEGSVEVSRFEEIAGRPVFGGGFGVVSVRAVRLDQALFSAVGTLLRSGGFGALFRSADGRSFSDAVPPSLRLVSTHPLLRGSRSTLTLLQKA